MSDSDDAAGSGRATLRVPALACAALAFLTFTVSLRGTYVYDDLPIVRDDPRVTDSGEWIRFFSESYWPEQFNVDNLYRPIASLSFALEWRLHGDRPWAFHLVNNLLHAVATALLTVLAGRLFGLRAAWMVGVLFAVHPVHVEAVSGLVGRAELLCAIGMFGGLALCLSRPMTPARIAGIFGCFLLALGAKEQGILFPLLAGGCLILRMGTVPISPGDALSCKTGTDPVSSGNALPRERSEDAVDAKRLRLLAVGLLWALAAYVVYREHILRFWWPRERVDWSSNPIVHSHGLDRLLLPIVLIGRSLLLLVAPANLSMDYGGAVITETVNYRDPFLYLGIAAVLLWLALSGMAWRARSWRTLGCLLAFALVYGMTSNLLILINMTLAERVLYIPSGFFLIIAAAWASRLRARRSVSVVVMILACLGIARSVTYARLWNDPPALFAHTLEAQPMSYQAHSLLFHAAADRHEWADALRIAEQARRRIPDYKGGYLLCAEALAHLGEADRAREMITLARQHGASTEAALFLAGLIEEYAKPEPPQTQPAR
jgi:hypothetical protein